MIYQFLADDQTIADFAENNADTNSFKIKQKLTGQTGDNGTKNVKTIVPLKNLNNFWRTLEMLSVNYEINLDLNGSKRCIIVTNNAGQRFL